MSSETSSSPQNSPRKLRKGFVVVALILFAMFVGCLLTATWFLEHLVSGYLSEPKTYGNTRVIPFGHSSKGFLYHEWDSVQVQNPAFEITIRHPSFQGHLLFSIRDDFLRISADSVSAKIHPARFPASKKDSMNYEFPNFRIPLRARVQVNHADVSVDSIGHWICDSLQVRTRGRQAADLRMRNLLGTHIDRFTGIDGRLRWNTDFVDAEITAGSEDGDSVTLAANALRTSLRNVSGSIAVNVADPLVWLPPGLIPKKAPSATNIRFKSSFSADLATKRYSCRGTLRVRTGAFWPLPAFDAGIQYSATSKGDYTIDATLIDDDGGEINLRGNLDKKLNASVEGSVQDISAEFGPQMMPLDLTIHSARKTGDELDFDISTRRDSKVRGKIKSLTHAPEITFTADIDKNEPWALDWCKGDLRLGSRPKIQGKFKKGILSAHVEIAPVEYAYKMHADSLAVDLALNKNGIHFSDGFFRGAKDDFDFTGEVLWNDSIPHTSWEVHQKHGGSANVWVSFKPEIKMQAENVRIGTIPFADTTILHGMDGNVTGTLNEDFATYVGSAQVDATTEIQGVPIRAKVSVRENGDSLYLDKAEFFQDKNKVDMEATAYLHYDSTAGSFVGFSIVDAWASTQSFDLPLLFAPFKGIPLPLRTGRLSGNIEYRSSNGFEGSLLFDSLSLKGVTSQTLSIPKLRLFAEKEKVEMDGDVLLGNGIWNGALQVSVDHILESKRHLSVSHTVWNGGTLWLSGDLDSNLEWKGELNANGSWFLPANAGEIPHTDLHADIDAKLKEGLDGINASFKSDSTLYDTEKGFLFPFSFSGTLNQGIVDVATFETKNELREKIQAALRYDIHKSALEKFDFHTDSYTFVVGTAHEIHIKNATGHLSDSKKEMTLAMELPLITYKLKDTTIGHAEASAHGVASLHLPHTKTGSFANTSIDGNILIDRAVFKKQLSADIGIHSFNNLTKRISNFFTRLRHSRPAPVEKTAATGRPTNIAIHISDSGQDSVAIVSNFAAFPLTVDVWALGTTDHPILRGDINNSGSGFFGLQGLFQFNLEAFAVTWQDVPWQRGTLNISGSEDIPYCESNEEKDETCPVTLNITGTVTNPQPLPTMDCGTESTPAAVYYSVLLGCVTEDQSSTPIDRNRIAGKVLGGMLSSTANKAFGGKYVGDIDMKLPLFNDNATTEKDSSYLRIPISLDRWIKNLSLVFGYKQDQSENPTYDQAIEAGLNYTLPVFAEKDKENPNHYDPRLDFSGNLVSKRYVTALESDESENRLEKNIGFNYSYRFWAPCLLGIGNCPVPETETDGKEGAR